MKIISWNVNGIRAIAKKTFFNDLQRIGGDIVCFQETKANEQQVKEVMKDLKGFHVYANASVKPGYSGTAIITRSEPQGVVRGINIGEHDNEGRVICLEYEIFFLVNVYVPNSGSELKRLDYRREWDLAFFRYLKDLETRKPVIVCGDFNVAHRDIDIARPKSNYNKSAGYMQEEIDGMDRFLNGGFADTFRRKYPDLKDKYSWWSYRLDAREKNVGWRIDYFLVSESLMTGVKDAIILDQYMGSDHCPVGIEIY
ncbi:MAG TPA: exodeoxyribonuclease III [Bacteroidales bacterium]|nr:exodeoxyribonuclease III [Bacteroidales bacterium]